MQLENCGNNISFLIILLVLTVLSYPSLYILRIMLKTSHLWKKNRIFLLITPASFPYTRNKTRLVTDFQK